MTFNWRYILLVPVATIVLLYTGKYITTAPILIVGVVAAVILGLITFLKPENGLMVLVFSMLLSPEIVLAGVPGRNIVVRVDDLLIAAILIAWLAHTAVDKEWKGFVKTPLDIPIILLSLIYILSTSKAIFLGEINPVKSFFYVLKYLEYFVLYWLTTNIIQTRQHIPKYLTGGLVTCVIVTIFAYSLFGKVERIYGPFDSEAAGATMTGESASLGGYIVIVMAVLLSFAAFAEKTNWWLLGMFAALIPPLIRTLSRASFYAFAATLITFVVLTPRRRPFFVVIIIIGALLLPFTGKFYYQSMVNRLNETFQGSETYSVGASKIKLEGSAAARVNSWRRAFNEWLPRKPLLGHGMTGVGLADTQYPLFLGEIGIIGFGIFAYLILRIYYLSWKTLKRATSALDKSLALGLIAALSGLLVQSIAVNTFIIVRIMEPFWFLTALVIGVQNYEEGRAEVK